MSGFELERYLEELQEFVDIDSGSHDIAGLTIAAQWLEKKYDAVGMKTELRFLGENRRPILIACSPAVSSDKKSDVLFIGHLDTVFPEGTVAERPFRISDGNAYGSGVADMKSGVLLTVYLAERFVRENPHIRLIAVHNCDEEIGSIDSEELIKSLGAKTSYCFDMEPGRQGRNFVKNRKGVAEYKISFKGRASHAGNAPEKGISAVRELARWVYDTFPLNDASAGINVNVGVVSGGTASNVIPEFAECIIDVRYPEMELLPEVEKKFMAMAAEPAVEGVIVKVEKLSGFPPMAADEKTDIMMDALLKAGEKTGQSFEFESVGGGSDGSLISSVGTPVIDGCGPVGYMYHTPDEYMDISSIEERYALLYEAINILMEK